jgi:hypothetical protein
VNLIKSEFGPVPHQLQHQQSSQSTAGAVAMLRYLRLCPISTYLQAETSAGARSAGGKVSADVTFTY